MHRTVLGIALAAGLTVGAAVAVPAAAVTVLPPTLSVHPHSVMVDTDATVVGRNFLPGTTVHLEECSSSTWVVPVAPCTTDNAVSATANAHGAFAVKMRIEACPPPAAPVGIVERCYVGVPQPSGIDTVSLRPAATVIVSFP